VEEIKKYFKIQNKLGDILMVTYESEYMAHCRCTALGESWGCKSIEITKEEYNNLANDFCKANKEFLGV